MIIAGLADKGPATDAGLQTGDLLVAVDGKEVDDLASLFRGIWTLGSAGVAVPIRVHREGRTFDVTLKSADRAQFLKRPRLH